MISNKQNVEDEALKVVGLTHLKFKAIEKFKLKIKLKQTLKNQLYTRYTESFKLLN